MANTERLRAMRRVHGARKAVESALLKKNLDSQAREVLEDVSDQLETAQDRLFLEELERRTGQLIRDSKELQKLAEKMRKSVRRLKDVAVKVERAAQGIKLFAEILSKAAVL